VNRDPGESTVPGLLRRLHPTQEPAASETALVAQARDDREAFAALYDRYFDAVYRYCYHRLGSREAAEDATSQIFLQVLTALPRYQEVGTFRSWVFTIAHNVITNCARARRPIEPLDAANQHADPAPLPEELALAADEHRALAAGVATLPPDQRRAVELRLAGLTGPEIARVLGRSHAAVKMLQLRAVDRLRTQFGVGAVTEEAPDATR
jgi:RNA polymerase sigma-70 factor (ECF subfamily)